MVWVKWAPALLAPSARMPLRVRLTLPLDRVSEPRRQVVEHRRALLSQPQQIDIQPGRDVCRASDPPSDGPVRDAQVSR